MAIRRRSAEEHENHERWLVSYADFITLLFAFFVVMYAISTLNEGKYRVLSDALLMAFRHDRVVTPQTTGVAPINRTTATPTLPVRVPRADPLRREQERRLLDLASRIKEALAPLMKTGQVRLTQLPRGIAVEINASVLFAPAQATLQPESIAALQAVAAVLAKATDPVQVEGHTDNLPIASAVFPSNWELASARASAVVRLFVQAGVDPARLAAIGYADNRPVESNDTPEGRARNRRVTLMIVAAPPTSDAVAAPPPANAAPAPVEAARDAGAAPRDAAAPRDGAAPRNTVDAARDAGDTRTLPGAPVPVMSPEPASHAG
jgi:chemotaxis protein MotB